MLGYRENYFVVLLFVLPVDHDSSVGRVSAFGEGCHGYCIWRSSPEVIKRFISSTQLSTKFILFINVKMPTIVANNCWHFNIYLHDKYNI